MRGASVSERWYTRIHFRMRLQGFNRSQTDDSAISSRMRILSTSSKAEVRDLILTLNISCPATLPLRRNARRFRLRHGLRPQIAVCHTALLYHWTMYLHHNLTNYFACGRFFPFAARRARSRRASRHGLPCGGGFFDILRFWWERPRAARVEV
jgi:hypothetical protein